MDAADAVFYPDLMVTYDPRDRGQEADGRWVLESFGPEGKLALASLDLTLAAIYEGVEFPAP